MDYQQHYARLFAPLEKSFGKLDDETLTSIVGYTMGGPVSVCKISAHRIFVTTELSVIEKQQRSTDGIKFELFSKGDFNEDRARKIFMALSNLSMTSRLGHGHTIDVSCVTQKKNDIVLLNLFSKTQINRKKFGLYQVSPVKKSWFSKLFR
jgi:hypothetical protein